MKWYSTLVWVALFLLIFQSAFAQDDECPTPPEGLSNVANLDWVEPDDVVRLGIGSAHDNIYKNIWLEWDIFSGELEVVPLPGTIEALQLIDRLGLNIQFFYPPQGVDQTYLSLSPSLQNAVYFEDADIYGVGLEDDSEPSSLGTLTFTTLDSMTWLSDNDLVIVGEPPYGTRGFDNIIAHVCLDGSCFIDFSHDFADSLGRPGIDIAHRKMAVYGIYDSTIFIYDLDDDTLVSDLVIDVALQPIFRPLWSGDRTSLYVMSYGTGINLELYRITLDTGEIAFITDVNQEISGQSWDNWLLSEERRFFIISTSNGIFVQCF